jgi:hypothetical protein
MRSPLVLALSSALFPATALAGYDPCPSTDWGVSTMALEAEQAYTAAEARDLHSAIDDLRAAVSCLDEAMTPETAAAVHRAHALVADWEGDVNEAYGAWRAALLAEPGWEPPLELAPPGGALAETIERARGEGEPSRSTLDVPRGMALRLDGEPSWRRARGLPVVLQLIDGEGRPVRTEYLPAGVMLPPGIHVDRRGDRRDPEPRGPTMRVSNPSGPARAVLLGGAGALALGAVGLGVASARIGADTAETEAFCEARIEGCSPGTERQIADGQQLSKRLGIGAGAAAAAGVALGVTVVVAW